MAVFPGKETVRPMEIIHVVLGKANPQRMNGVNKVVFQLATRQTLAGRSVSVWGISKSTEHNYEARNFNTVLFKAHRNPFRVDALLAKAIREKKGTAVFHLHGGWIPVFSMLARLFHKEGIPFVLTPHGAYNTIAMQRSGYLKRVYFQLFEKSLLTKAHRIHCIGESEVTGLGKILQTDKTFLMPYGFESTSKVTPIDSDAKGRKFIVGFVGRLDIYTKGLDLLLKSFEEFHRSFPLSMLWIVGDGPGRQQLEKQILGKGLEANIILWGSMFGVDKDNLMKQMHVFAHPSRNEGLPMSVLEAAALGIPCIVSEATNVGTHIRNYDAGRVTRNENVTDLIQSLEAMYALNIHSMLDEPGARAKQMVKEVFNWGTIVTNFDALYQK
jgi:glycosyltransferase involved in cell wall biosynthesis